MNINGILLIDKPEEFTSFDVVAKLRGIAKTRKIGHGGTLDPMATGVLPVFFGNATRCCSLLPEKRKRYRARFRLGISTDTQDITGKIIETSKVEASQEMVFAAARSFIGRSGQIPPMYSAVKVGGKKLCDLARKNIEIERAERQIEIFSLEISHFDADEYEIDVECSQGTYIRTLCSDIGDRLGCGAAVTYLRRTESSGFGEYECITIAQAQTLADEGKLAGALLPTDRIFASYPEYRLNDFDTRLHLNGVRIWTSRLPELPDAEDYIRIYDANGNFLSLSYIDHDAGQLAVKAYFYRREQ